MVNSRVLSTRYRTQIRGAICAVILCLSSCASGGPAPGSGDAAREVSATSVNRLTDADSSVQCNDAGALHELSLRRGQEDAAADYPVGPGDVLNVSVAD